LATLIASLFAGQFLPPYTAILMDSAEVWQWVDFFLGAESTGWEPTISKKYYLKRNKQLYQYLLYLIAADMDTEQNMFCK
jgi:hypothetical protein